MLKGDMFRSIRFVVLSILCYFALTQTSIARSVIEVTDQLDFDRLQNSITDLIKKGEKDIHVSFAPGTYVAKEKHLALIDIKAVNTKIIIEGNGASILPEGRMYRNGDAYRGDFSVNNSWTSGLRDVEIWSSIEYADSLIEIVNIEEKLCRLKVNESFSANTDISNAYILIPHWYQSSVYKIDRISGNEIYFTANNLKESSYGGYNVNDDFNYGKKRIRYKLCNVKTKDNNLCIIDGKVHLLNGIVEAWEGEAHCFLMIKNCKLSAVEIQGLEFHGNAYAKSKPAIYLKNTDCQEIRIHHCGFYGMRGDVISIVSTPNIRIDNNQFKDCYRDGVISDNSSSNLVVDGNTFLSMGKRMSNSFCVVCRGKNFHVSDNIFCNFGYGAICIGVWHKGNMKHPCEGVVEKNDICLDQDYLSCIDNFGIMDGGAIYLTTKNAGSVIRYNYIHGFSGMKSNRGIFCDNGAYNVEIYGNIITGITNSRCIDSRRCAKVESSRTPESGIGRSNVNVVILDNIVDGGIRLEGNESENNGCVKGTNYILLAKDAEMPSNVFKNVDEIDEDVVLEYNGMELGRIGISPSSYQILRSTNIWPKISGYVIKKQ